MALASQALSFNYVLIQPIGGKPVDLTSSLEHIEYFENIMSPTITMNMNIIFLILNLKKLLKGLLRQKVYAVLAKI